MTSSSWSSRRKNSLVWVDEILGQKFWLTPATERRKGKPAVGHAAHTSRKCIPRTYKSTTPSIPPLRTGHAVSCGVPRGGALLVPSGSDSEERLSWQKQISKQPSQAVRRRLSFSPPLSYNFIPSLAISFCPYGACGASGAACVYYCERGGGSLSAPRAPAQPREKRLRRAGKQRSPRRRGRGEKTLFTLNICARGAAATTIPSLCLFFSLGAPSPRPKHGPFLNPPRPTLLLFFPLLFFHSAECGRRKKKSDQRVGAAECKCVIMQPARRDSRECATGAERAALGHVINRGQGR